MLHIVKLIERRYPNQSRRIIGLLIGASLALLLVGVALRWAG